MKYKYHYSQSIQWLIAILIFIISMPFYFWPSFSYPLFFVARFLLLIVFIPFINCNRKEFLLGVVLIIFNIFFNIKSGINNDNKEIRQIIQIIYAMLLIPFFMGDKKLWKDVFNKYKTIFAILLIPSILEYLLYTFFNISLFSFNTECPINPGRPYRCSIFFCYLQGIGNIINFHRFFAFHDEPGVIGNIAMVLLYTSKYNMKEWRNILIFIAGVLSFSMLFYIASVLYILIFGNNKIRILSILILLIVLIYGYENEILYNFIFKRFELTNDKFQELSRDNIDFLRFCRHIKFSDYLLPYKGGYVPYSAQWKYNAILYGFIPFISYVLLIIYKAFVNIGRNKTLLIYVIMLLSILYQRPFIWNPFYQFLMIIPIYLYSDLKYDNVQVENRRCTENIL